MGLPSEDFKACLFFTSVEIEQLRLEFFHDGKIKKGLSNLGRYFIYILRVALKGT